MNKDIYKDQITYFKAKLGLLGLLLAAFLIGEFLVGWREYQLSRTQKAGEAELTIARQKFDELWQKLTLRTVPVELESEIRYGENIGKLEPFD